MLGICRGLQVLNVWGGGTLLQHLPDHARYDVPDRAVSTRSSWRRAAACTRCTGPGWTSTRCTTRRSTAWRRGGGWSARSADGTAEALEWPGHDVMAVQWHPEMLPGASTDPIFAWLVERAGALATTATTAS